MDEWIMHIRIVETCSQTDFSVEHTSKGSEIDTYSDRNSSTESELSELAYQTTLVETQTRRSIRTLVVIATCYRARKFLITRQMTWR